MSGQTFCSSNTIPFIETQFINQKYILQVSKMVRHAEDSFIKTLAPQHTYRHTLTSMPIMSHTYVGKSIYLAHNRFYTKFTTQINTDTPTRPHADTHQETHPHYVQLIDHILLFHVSYGKSGKSLVENKTIFF